MNPDLGPMRQHKLVSRLVPSSPPQTRPVHTTNQPRVLQKHTMAAALHFPRSSPAAQTQSTSPRFLITRVAKLQLHPQKTFPPPRPSRSLEVLSIVPPAHGAQNCPAANFTSSLLSPQREGTAQTDRPGVRPLFVPSSAAGLLVCPSPHRHDSVDTEPRTSPSTLTPQRPRPPSCSHTSPSRQGGSCEVIQGPHMFFIFRFKASTQARLDKRNCDSRDRASVRRRLTK